MTKGGSLGGGDEAVANWRSLLESGQPFRSLPQLEFLRVLAEEFVLCDTQFSKQNNCHWLCVGLADLPEWESASGEFAGDCSGIRRSFLVLLGGTVQRRGGDGCQLSEPDGRGPGDFHLPFLVRRERRSESFSLRTLQLGLS